MIKLRVVLLVFAILMVRSSYAQNTEKPNIIYIFTDQQNASMMSCAGNEWLKTPAMDYIAENGVRFTRAYVTNPVCTPSRISLMTGRFPGSFTDNKGDKVYENWGAIRVSEISDEVKNTTIASWLKKAGYDLYFGGKQHLPKPLLPEAHGFTIFSKDERSELAKDAAKIINSKPRNPYFMVVSLINPHDICYMAIRDFAETDHEKRLVSTGVQEVSTLDKALVKPKGVTDDEFYKSYAPPLPPNYEPQEGEPKAIQALLNQRNFRKKAREEYTDENWRLHRWAYCRLTETVDHQIQTVLDAVRESGQEENTLIVFSSDHGDMDSSHRMEHKSTPYEESANVPFLMMWKGKIPAGVVDDKHLISNGLDLLPTITDYAGLKGASDPRGLSIKSLLEGETNWRKTLGVETEVGRMVVHEDGYKFIRYFGVDEEEQLLDLNLDPFETKHFTTSDDHKNILANLRLDFETVWFD
ncbi:sulfatase-like hydrolase/transferase [Aurantibacter crassamenti]|uniref:sulfatase family protein n=1 Tax=Aurantibacter crassamenti TaxID=1837375 RepID=UPI00193938FE|nr:sulfatase-like hydrolase/transferase [Aurantibacter crassamenti]MBM1105486.1 sulfatase-like hydrolase/transferase [Aurantibacter crassamenti]